MDPVIRNAEQQICNGEALQVERLLILVDKEKPAVFCPAQIQQVSDHDALQTDLPGEQQTQMTDDVEARDILAEIAASPALSLRLRLWETEDGLQLFGLYFVFQGVILTALAQAQTMGCHHWWIPFLLTTFTDLGVTFAVWYKLYKCDGMKHEVDVEKANSRAVKRTMERFLGLGADYESNNVVHHAVVVPILKKTKMLWKIVITLVITAFSSVTAVACKLILCD